MTRVLHWSKIDKMILSYALTRVTYLVYPFHFILSTFHLSIWQNWKESNLICHNYFSLQWMTILYVFLCWLHSWSFASLDSSFPSLRFLFFFECSFTAFHGNLPHSFQNRSKTVFSLKLEEMITYLALQLCQIGNSKLTKLRNLCILSQQLVLILNFSVFELAKRVGFFGKYPLNHFSVGNNTERGGWISVITLIKLFHFHNQIHICYFHNFLWLS